MFLRLPLPILKLQKDYLQRLHHTRLSTSGMVAVQTICMQLLYTPSAKNANSAPLYRGIQLDRNARVRVESRLHEDPRFGALMSEMNNEDTEGGEFSFIEYNSGSGLLSAAVAERYPRATVISVETEETNVQAHLQRLKRLAQSKVEIAGADLKAEEWKS